MTKTLAKITKVNIITSQGAKEKFTVEMPHQVLADELVNLFAGLPAITTDALLDAEGNRITDIETLKKKGCVFAHISVMRNLADDRYCTKFINRKKDCPNPLLQDGVARFEIYDMIVLLNIIWANKVAKLIEKYGGNQDFQVKAERPNSIENYKDSRVVCVKDNDYYINYIVHSYMDNRVVINENGHKLDDAELEILNSQLKSSYRKEVKQKGAEKQAQKMGIPVEALPDIRQMRMENVGRIKVFGKDFIPIENI